MKTKEQIKDKIKKLEDKVSKVWNNPNPIHGRNDIIDGIYSEIKILKWVLKKNKL